MISKTFVLSAIVILLFSTNITVTYSDTVHPAPHKPELMFDVNDEDMTAPLGIINDVAVGTDSVVYLLDEQNCNIRRITFSGELIFPLGMKGEGPGEFSRPRRLALFNDGRCFVMQDMSSRVPCLTPTGDACDMMDISPFRTGYGHVIVMRAETDPFQRLILTAITMRYRSPGPGSNLEDLGTAASVRRAGAGEEQVETLFSTEYNAPGANAFNPVRGWDINNDGIIIYADLGGRYSVNIGHPTDGETFSIDLPQWEYDEEKIKVLADELGDKFKADELSRVGGVEWLDNEFFMVFPMAEVKSTPVTNLINTVEVYSRDGDGFGRYDIQCDFDPANDTFFIRGDVLIVIKGGKAVGRAVYDGLLPPQKAPEGAPPKDVEEVRIVAYRLFGSLRAIN